VAAPENVQVENAIKSVKVIGTRFYLILSLGVFYMLSVFLCLFVFFVLCFLLVVVAYGLIQMNELGLINK